MVVEKKVAYPQVPFPTRFGSSRPKSHVTVTNSVRFAPPPFAATPTTSQHHNSWLLIIYQSEGSDSGPARAGKWLNVEEMRPSWGCRSMTPNMTRMYIYSLLSTYKGSFLISSLTIHDCSACLSASKICIPQTHTQRIQNGQ